MELMMRATHTNPCTHVRRHAHPHPSKHPIFRHKTRTRPHVRARGEDCVRWEYHIGLFEMRELLFRRRPERRVCTHFSSDRQARRQSGG